MNRELGKKVLEIHLSIERNITILESKIFDTSTTTEEYIKKIYECAGYLSQGWVKEYHEDIKASLTGFELGVFQDYIDFEKETDLFLSADIEVEEGALVCPRCKSAKTFSYTKQVRSADEGTSVFARCYNCENKWRES